MSKKRIVLGVDLDALSPPEPLSEGVLGTVSDVKIEEAVDVMMVRLEQAMQFHIMQDRSKDPVQRSRALSEAKDKLRQIREEVMKVVIDGLSSYSPS